MCYLRSEIERDATRSFKASCPGRVKHGLAAELIESQNEVRPKKKEPTRELFEFCYSLSSVFSSLAEESCITCHKLAREFIDLGNPRTSIRYCRRSDLHQDVIFMAACPAPYGPAGNTCHATSKASSMFRGSEEEGRSQFSYFRTSS
jgi:hypothetical protein